MNNNNNNNNDYLQKGISFFFLFELIWLIYNLKFSFKTNWETKLYFQWRGENGCKTHDKIA